MCSPGGDAGEGECTIPKGEKPAGKGVARARANGENEKRSGTNSARIPRRGAMGWWLEYFMEVALFKGFRGPWGSQ
jgi:hypothetical protein